MGKIVGVLATVVIAGLTTAAILFAVRQIPPLARVAGIAPANSMNPLNDLKSAA